MSADSDEFVVELMKQCELKLVLLQQELHGKEFSAIMKEMEEEEVRRLGEITKGHVTCLDQVGLHVQSVRLFLVDFYFGGDLFYAQRCFTSFSLFSPL